MSYWNDPMGAALDRYITGNWGEDSVGDEEEEDDYPEEPAYTEGQIDDIERIYQEMRK